MVTIRLTRTGAKKRPFYHIIVTDSRSRRDGRYIERLGYFNPVARNNAEGLRVDLDRADYWLGKGAKPSDRVQQLLKQWRKTAGEALGKAPAEPAAADAADAGASAAS
jgi:small subunit ribosomal protein S16